MYDPCDDYPPATQEEWDAARARWERDAPADYAELARREGRKADAAARLLLAMLAAVAALGAVACAACLLFR